MIKLSKMRGNLNYTLKNNFSSKYRNCPRSAPPAPHENPGTDPTIYAVKIEVLCLIFPAEKLSFFFFTGLVLVL